MIQTRVTRRALALVLGGLLAVSGAEATELALRPLGPEVLAVRYRPRTDAGAVPVIEPAPRTPVVFQLHLGSAVPAATDDDDVPSSFAGGLRVGPLFEKRIQVGAALDWFHRSAEVRSPIAAPLDLDGFPINYEQVLSSRAYDIVPAMVFVQVGAPPESWMAPYAGLAGGYEWMHVSGTDETGETFEADYGAPAWQTWLGLSFALGRHARLGGEVFYLGSQPQREVRDEQLGYYQERIDADMAGVRFGLSFGF